MTQQYECISSSFIFFSAFSFKVSVLRLSTVSGTYGSLDFGIKVPNSLIRSLMLNRRLLSTAQQEREKTKTKSPSDIRLV